MLLKGYVFDKHFGCLGSFQIAKACSSRCWFWVCVDFCILGRLGRAGIQLSNRNEAICWNHESCLDVRYENFGHEARNIALVAIIPG